MGTDPLTSTEAAQENLYSYPYHYLPRLVAGKFQLQQVMPWGHEYLSYISHVARLVEATGSQSVLDVGCGDGRLASLLKSRLPDVRVVGVDRSIKAISLAKAMAPHAEFVAGDITQPQLFQNSFDCSTCIDTLEHIEPGRLADFVRGIRTHLKKGATFIATVPSVNVPLNPKHFQHFDTGLLESTLAPEFDVKEIGYLNGNSRLLRVFRSLLTNRIYTVTHPLPLTAFYRYYIRTHLHSDSSRCSRLLAVCEAR